MKYIRLGISGKMPRFDNARVSEPKAIRVGKREEE